MSECDPVNFPSLLCLRRPHCGREYQASDEISPAHGFPPLLETIVTFRAIEWQRGNGHGSYGSLTVVRAFMVSAMLLPLHALGFAWQW
jgi:hypothetical protein